MHKLTHLLFLLPLLFGCSENNNVSPQHEEVVEEGPEVVNLSPFWRVRDRIFHDGPPGAFDDTAVKDPTIVQVDGKYHMFFTGRNLSNWSLGYATAATLEGFTDAEHIELGVLNATGYAAAPQVFFNRYDSLWYLVYQTGPATFSTNDDITDPDGWSPGQSMGFDDGLDFWVITDSSYWYCFYSAQDGTGNIKRRRTTMVDFPFGWGQFEITARNTFEAVHVYKNLANAKYYMIVEDIARHIELWEADEIGGNWTQLAEEWAHIDNLVHRTEQWTEQVSHPELIRAGYNELMEIESLNRCQMLFQGVMDGDYGTYSQIPYDLGFIQNY